MAEHKDRIEQTFEMLVYAPIGAGLYLKDMGPTFVNMFVARGRAEIDRRHAQVQQRTTTAKSVGQVAVAFGVPMVRQRVEREVGNARQRAQSFLESVNGVDAPTPARPSAARAASRTRAGSGRRRAGRATRRTVSDVSLPIPGYDALSASQVVERLAGLSPGELDAVRSYEGEPPQPPDDPRQDRPDLRVAPWRTRGRRPPTTSRASPSSRTRCGPSWERSGADRCGRCARREPSPSTICWRRASAATTPRCWSAPTTA